MKVFQIIRNITGTIVFETESQVELKAEIARADLDFGIYTVITGEKSDRAIAEEKYDELTEDIYGYRMKIEMIESDLNAAIRERRLLEDDYGFNSHHFDE
jgi:hypothetical protein